MNIRQLGFQEFDIINSVKSTTKYAVNLNNTKNIQYELEKSCFLAKNGRPGPVWLDIPLDIQNSQITIKKNKSFFFKKKKLFQINHHQKRSDK
jgi:acetolactate synthase-1/2/3 large subunit